jgi:cysteine-rich repeat protein
MLRAEEHLTRAVVEHAAWATGPVGYGPRMKSALALVVVGLGLSLACGDDGSGAADEGSTGAEATVGTGMACELGQARACICEGGDAGEQMCTVSGWSPCGCSGADVTTDDATSSPGSSSDGGGMIVCGNGRVDANEQCDDGNDDDDDACSNNCVADCGLMWELSLPEGFNPVRVELDATGNLVVAGATLAGATGLALARATYGIDGSEVRQTSAAEVWEASAAATAALDSADDAFVFTRNAEAGEMAQSNRLYKYDDAFAEQWQIDLDPSLLMQQLDVAATPEDDVVLVAAIEVSASDDDVWLAKYSGVDGAEVWTTTYTGPTQGGFSTDEGGKVAVASDGTIYVAARIRITFNRQEVTLLRFGPDGGMPDLETMLLDDPGSNHDQFPFSLAANGMGQTAVGLEVFGLGIVEDRSVLAFADGDTLPWSVSSPDEFRVGDDSLGMIGPALDIDDDGNVMVALSHQLDIGKRGFIGVEAVIARYDSAGVQQCAFTHAVPSSFRQVIDARLLPDGSLAVVGLGGEGSWLARFRK